mgnify:CR=1 FL=1|tara:strand:+ start:150 stop:1361 length:1212 start_codon:yes stop_codon:yes gene_type:complete
MSKLGTWDEDEASNQRVQDAYNGIEDLGFSSDAERRQFARKLAGNSNFTKPSKRAGGKNSDIYMSYPVARTNSESIGDTLQIKCIEYFPPDDMGYTVNVDNVFKEPTDEAIKSGRLKEGQRSLITSEERKADPERFGVPSISVETTDANTRLSQNQKVKYYIELPIPQEINDSNSVTWGEDRINAIEMATLSVAQQAMANPGGTLQDARAAVSALETGVKIPGLNSDAQAAVRAAISGAALNQLGSQVSSKSVISRSTGQILNNNLELLFSGVNLRSFPYSITFSPRSRTESDVVKSIIRSLKMSMAPKAGEFNGSAAQGIFLKSPDVFQLNYLKDGKNHPFLNKFKICALTGMQVNYTNAGTYTSYSDGTPVNIRMNLTFKEINPIYHEDYLQGASGSGVGY